MNEGVRGIRIRFISYAPAVLNKRNGELSAFTTATTSILDFDDTCARREYAANGSSGVVSQIQTIILCVVS